MNRRRAGHVEGPRFSVRTWCEDGAWHATVTVISPLAAPYPNDALWTTDDDPAGATRPALAVRRAVERFLDLHGDRCLCSLCDAKDGRCRGNCACEGKARIAP